MDLRLGLFRRGKKSIARVLAVALVAGLLPLGFAAPAAAQPPTLAITKWDVDTATGVVDYDVTVSGLCSSSMCGWTLSGQLINGDIDRLQKDFGGDTIYASSATPVPYQERINGTIALPEITHLKFSHSIDNAPLSTELTEVHAPYPAGSITLPVNLWDANVETGKVTYDLDMTFDQCHGQSVAPERRHGQDHVRPRRGHQGCRSDQRALRW